uniref:NAD-dependent epimerase/dehydratase family protein n=1 Tax=candidate division CPR3 bacterium TaxID=2268181 RepID=A0A7C5Z2Z7_UNCC3
MARKRQPHILVVNGVNLVGQYLIQTLLEQGAYVYVLGRYDTKAREFIKIFKRDSFKYFDISVAPLIKDRIDYLDYVFILLYEAPPTVENIDSKGYINEISLLHTCLELAVEKRAKLELITSMLLEKRLMGKEWSGERAYTYDDVQAFAENAVLEYCKKQGLNGRVVRLGEVYGRGMDINSESYLVKMIKQALTEEEITVPGDGLQFLYYIHVLDAVYGILKAVFTDGTSGKIFTLANPQEISLLALAHKLLEQSVVATKVRFEKNTIPAEPLFDKGFTLSNQLSKIGWKPKISFERGLGQTVDYFKEILNIKEKREERDKKFEEDLREKKEGVFIDVKIDEVLPVEISKEKKRIERVKKKILEEGARRRRALLSAIVKWFLGSVLFSGLALLYFFFFVPVVGLVKTTYFMQSGLNSYLFHLKSGDLQSINDDKLYIKKQTEAIPVYVDHLSWFFKISKTEGVEKRIVSNIYGVEAFTNGCEYLIQLPNGISVISNNENPQLNSPKDAQLLVQAKLNFMDAANWLKIGIRSPDVKGFWDPFEEAESISERLSKNL